MINSGVVKLYSETNELLAQKKYYIKGGRRWIVDGWMGNNVFKKLNCYYHILPDEDEKIKRTHQKTVIPDKEKPAFVRPPAVYSNSFQVRDLN